MLNPTLMRTSNLPIDNFSIKMLNDYVNNTVATKLYTPLYREKKTGSLWHSTKDHLRLQSDKRARGAEANSSDAGWFKTTYTTALHSWKGLVIADDAREVDRALSDLDEEVASRNMDVLMINMEKAAHDAATTAASYPSDLTTDLASVGGAWDTEAGNPVALFRTLSEAIADYCGKRPNSLFLSYMGFEYLRDLPDMKARYVHVHGGIITREMVAQVLQIQNIHISDIRYNSANEGIADSISTVWGNDAVLAYVDPTATSKLKSVTYGYMPVVNQLSSKMLPRPELGGPGDAYELETNLEYGLSPAAVIAEGNTDFAAGALIENIYTA
jgi:hypothetical protein